MPTDYYIVLGVSRGADLQKIKKAYRQVAKKYHPDFSGSPLTTDKFLEVKEAYETLSDDARRREYDRELELCQKVVRQPPATETLRPGPRAAVAGLDFYSDADDFFSGFLPGFFDVERNRLRAKDLYFEAILSPREARDGGLFPVTVPVFEACPDCGRGRLWEGLLCARCGGSGRIQSERAFSLSIPPHVRHGTEVTISLEDIGLRGAYLHVCVIVDPRMEEDALF